MFVITGGGSGIGQALAYALAQRDQEVLIVGRRKELLADTAAYSPLIQFISADVSTNEGRREIVSYLDSFPTLKGLINNAATVEPIASIKDISVTQWQHLMAVNLDAPLFLTQSLYSRLAQGRVLNIGSGAAYFPVAAWAGYCVSKAALAMLTRCWQIETKETAFASVMPGIIDTDMQAAIRSSSGMEPEKQSFFNTLKANNKLLKKDAVASFLCWLLLDVDKGSYSAQEWDIYDTSHHSLWLKAPHEIPGLE